MLLKKYICTFVELSEDNIANTNSSVDTSQGGDPFLLLNSLCCYSIYQFPSITEDDFKNRLFGIHNKQGEHNLTSCYKKYIALVYNTLVLLTNSLFERYRYS